VESTSGEPSFGQGWLSRPGARLSKACGKCAGTWVGVSARIYDSNSLGDRAKEGRGSERRHAGTGEEISACIHVANYMETGPRMVAEAIAGTAQILCGRGLTPACQWGPASSSHASE